MGGNLEARTLAIEVAIQHDDRMVVTDIPGAAVVNEGKCAHDVVAEGESSS
ncbi:hypothetical protein [Aureimonas sp. AU4]|uniref:hypothetical protein n=1 Tax=Aureimonas sp. AU4 TaxID=1638163 RepID=UPI000706A208|nr:hypothetical protein [Aureimonas sp. AU4]BAT30447.1 possible sporulation protein SpoIID [Aureimonas sp. AU4]